MRVNLTISFYFAGLNSSQHSLRINVNPVMNHLSLLVNLEIAIRTNVNLVKNHLSLLTNLEILLRTNVHLFKKIFRLLVNVEIVLRTNMNHEPFESFVDHGESIMDKRESGLEVLESHGDHGDAMDDRDHNQDIFECFGDEVEVTDNTYLWKPITRAIVSHELFHRSFLRR